MFNKLTCKVRFHIAVWSLSKSIRAASFIENFPQISAKPIAFQRNLFGKLPRNRPFFANRFSAKLASKISAKFPRNLPFFPQICPWKSREIWLFFRDLPEALHLICTCMKMTSFPLLAIYSQYTPVMKACEGALMKDKNFFHF